MNFESDERNLPQKISEDIISFILNEHLQPGDKLPNEAHLAKELNIGRSSLREAMKLLASRNIVTIRQGSGTYVASSPGVVDDPLGFTFIPDKKKLVQDLLEVRFLLEPAIAAMSATYADNNDIKKIVSLCDEVEELLKHSENTDSLPGGGRSASQWQRSYPERYRIPHRNSNGKQESYYPKTHSDYQQLNSSFC